MSRLFGDRDFYRRVLHVAIPILIQTGITTFVSLIDNIMVGMVGTLEMSGVSIVNQLIFVFNLGIFGATSGAGIFTAQFFGAGDLQGVRYTFRYKVLLCSLIAVIAVLLLSLGDVPLIGLFLQGEGLPEDAAAISGFGQEYLAIMLWGLLPFALSSAYSGTLREGGQTVVPMVASIIAVATNTVLNAILIFGLLGFQPMGVKGAAIATVIARFTEFAVVAVWTHLNSQKNPFITGIYRSLRIPGKLLGQMLGKGMPLLMNEVLWSLSIAFVNQCYSTCSLEVVNATNIATTLNNLANVVNIALANTISILIGQMLGANRAKDQVWNANQQLLRLAVLAGFVFGGVLAAISGVYPMLYNTTDSIRTLASQLILITAVMKPVTSYLICAYYSIRSGGKTWITFFYDSGTLCLLQAPLAFCLSRFTDLPILPMYMICQLPDVFKCVLGYIMVHSKTWMQNLAIEKQ